MPDDPKKLIQYVLIFLPGFLALGFFVYVTSIELGELPFTYLSVTLSLLVFAVVRLITGWRFNAVARKGVYEDAGPGTYLLLITATILVALGIVWLHQSNVLLHAVNWLAPRTVMKLSEHTPFRGLLASEINGRLHKDIDQRDSVFRASAEKQGNDWVAQKYQMYVRLYLADSAVYEGRIIRFDTSLKSDGLPAVISPGCRVIIDPKTRSERFERLPGFGLYVTGKDLKYVELYDAEASGCRQCYVANGKARRNDAMCTDAQSAVNRG